MQLPKESWNLDWGTEDLIAEPELIAKYEQSEAVQGTNEHACCI